jgi:DNA modification methylase
MCSARHTGGRKEARMTAKILVGDVTTRLNDIPDASVQCVVTSPPYWGLRDYGHDEQIGLESTPEDYVARMVEVFREVRRVLVDDGTLWLNLGDSYANNGVKDASLVGGFTGKRIRAGSKGTMDSRPRSIPEGLKPKDLVGIPWRVAFALQADGWWLRQDIIWHKPNPMPESVTDRCTKAHEYIFLLSKSARYHYDHEAIQEPISEANRLHYDKYAATPSRSTTKQFLDRNDLGNTGTHCGFSKPGITYRNRRSVWTITTKPFKGAHFAVMPEALVEPCILAGSKPNDLILDPFAGSATVGVVALKHNRNFIGIELNPNYAEIARDRLTKAAPLLHNVRVEG